MSNELIQIQPEQAMEVFTKEDGLRPFIDKIINEVKTHVYDLDTDKGRKAIASLARKVGSSRNYLDECGKELVSGWKSKAKIVDNSRKAMREELTELQVTARSPLTEYEEAEHAKLVAAAAKAQRLEALEKRENDHEFALLMNDKFNSDKAEAERVAIELAIAQAEAQKLREEQIAANAKLEAESRAKQAELDKLAAEQRAKDAEEREILQAKLTKERQSQAEIDAKLRADEAAAEAVRQEQARQEQAEAYKIAAQAKIEANKQHVGSVRKAIKEQLMIDCQIDEELAVRIVKSLLKIDSVKIIY